MKRKWFPALPFVFFLSFQSTIFGQNLTLLKDINPGAGGTSFFNFTNVNGTMYFRSNDSVIGDELWKSNGTEGGTVLVKDINPGPNGSELQSFIQANGLLFFRADDGIHGSELWKSDGTAAGTVMVKDINPGTGGSLFSAMTVMNGELYFQAGDGVNGYELWKSDGTSAGTTLVKDIYPGIISSGFGAGSPYSGNPINLTPINGTLYFHATDGSSDLSLWKTDGTSAGTVKVKDAIPSWGPLGTLTNFINVNGTLFFTVYGGGNGNELWKSDGTNTGTVLVKGLDGGNFNNLSTYLNGILYFMEGDGLYRSDGTEAGTVLLKGIGSGFAYSPMMLIAANNQLYFTGYLAATGFELWKSDGTTAGTILIKDINPGVNNSEINSLIRVGSRVMFSANDGVNGNELWVSDGTGAGTRMVQDIEPGSGDGLPTQFYAVQSFAEAGGRLYVNGITTATGSEIWSGVLPADAGLPLDLLEFKASLMNNDGHLFWRTENEFNTTRFEIERSLDGVYFNNIGSVNSLNTQGSHRYSYVDKNITDLGVTMIYYRLRQIDIDGRYTYSGIVALPVDSRKMMVRVFPNPVQRDLQISITSFSPENLQWRILDNLGRVVKAGNLKLSPGITRLSENLDRFSSGIYYLQIFNGRGNIEQIKVVKE